MQIFEFTHEGDTYNVELTNGLIIDVEEAYGAPLDSMMIYKRGNISFMVNATMAIYVGILNNIALKKADYTLKTSMRELKKGVDFNYSNPEVLTNCIRFFTAINAQKEEWAKISEPDAKPLKKKAK